MRRILRWELVVLALGALSMGSGCPLVPEIKDRVVELAVGGSTTVEFVAHGILNNHNDQKTVDVKADIDLAKILDDAGISVADVDAISLSGVSYRVTEQDPVADRSINNANVTIRRGAGAETPLVTNFNLQVNNATNWTTAPLDPAGVTVVNDLLDALLTELQSGINPGSTQITYHVTGVSNPGSVPTQFTWELKLDISIAGKVTVKVAG